MKCDLCSGDIGRLEGNRCYACSHNKKPLRGIPFKGYTSAVYCRLCGLSFSHAPGCDGTAERIAA